MRLEEENKKICPFMNTGIPETYFVFYCEKEKCMAWGIVYKAKTMDQKDKFGCKLIERED